MIKKLKKIFYFAAPNLLTFSTIVLSTSCNNDRREATESLYKYKNYIEENFNYFNSEIIKIDISKDIFINGNSENNKLEQFNFEYLLCSGSILIKKNLYSFNGHNYKIEINPKSQSVIGTSKANVYLNIFDTNLNVRTTTKAIEIDGFKTTSANHNHYTYDYKIRDCETCKQYNK